MTDNIAIIVHGGAWDIPIEERAAHVDGCRKAVLRGYTVLRDGGTALDAVECAVMCMEDDPTFNAGTGAHLNAAGTVQLDAGIMDGATLQVGAVAAVERIKNPVRIARLLLSDAHNLLVGKGAEQWASRRQVMTVEPEELVVSRERQRYLNLVNNRFNPDSSRDTVGAVARDVRNNLAAATSTGGTMFKPVGRVGDSALPGCGYYADNHTAAISTTGEGEAIMRIQLARLAADLTTHNVKPAEAGVLFSKTAEAAINILEKRVCGRGGLVMIDASGHIGFAYNTLNMAMAYMHPTLQVPIAQV